MSDPAAGVAPHSGRRAAVALTALVTAVALLVAACTDSGDAPTDTTATTVVDTDVSSTVDDGQVRRGGRLRVALGDDPTPIVGWTPWDHVCAWACRNVSDAVLETLTVMLPDGSVHPWLARAVEPNADLDEWTVQIRAGITFSDGTPLDAATVKAGHDEFISEGAVTEGLLQDVGVTSVTATGPLTLVYATSEPTAAIPALLSGPVGKTFSVEAARIDPASFLRSPVGSGPFVFDSWSGGGDVELVANPDYWMRDPDGERLPRVETLSFVQLGDEDARLDAVRVGSVDVAQTRVPLTAERAVDLELQVVRRVEDNASTVVFNLAEHPLDDPRVREALVLATDRDVLRSLATDVRTPFPATHWWGPDSIWHSEVPEREWPAPDPDAARRLLAEYAQDPERSDERDPGELLVVRLACTDDLLLSNVARELETQWEATGFLDVQIETVSRTGLIQRVMGDISTRPQFVGDFDAACWRQGGESDPAQLLAPSLGQVKTSPLNFSNLETEELVALGAAIRSGTSEQDRRVAVNRAMLLMGEAHSAIPIAYSTSALIATPDVRGLATWSTPDEVAAAGQQGGVGRYGEVWLGG